MRTARLLTVFPSSLDSAGGRGVCLPGVCLNMYGGLAKYLNMQTPQGRSPSLPRQTPSLNGKTPSLPKQTPSLPTSLQKHTPFFPPKADPPELTEWQTHVKT